MTTRPEGAAAVEPAPAPRIPETAVLVGQPNVGKSAMFGALTQRYVMVSNYPGTTIEISRGRARVGSRTLGVLDTPGVHSMIPSSEDERVTRDILLSQPDAAAVVVGDAKEPTRTLALALQLIEMGRPTVLCLNMVDELPAGDLALDRERLGELLGIDIVPTVAVEGRGIDLVRAALEDPSVGQVTVRYPESIETAVGRIVPLLPESAITSRSLALMLLSGDHDLLAELSHQIGPVAMARIEAIRDGLRGELDEPVLYLINRARLQRADEIVREVDPSHRPDPAARSGLAKRIERLTIHPLWSLPLLAAVLYVVYLFVGVLGAGTLVDWMENGLFGRWINPAATRLADALIPWSFLRDLLVGPYGMITMALTYALALILPIVGTFFLVFGALEDSGYLPRLAVILNRAFKKMGLNGKAVLPMVLGLGCDTMATLTTRILETRKERLIVIILLSLGVPCSAQLAVIMAMLGSISVAAVGIWAAVVAGVILLVGALAARVLPGERSDFIVQLPPLRLPRLSNVAIKTLARIEWYLKEAVPLFLAGTAILFLADRVNLLERMRLLAEPVVQGWLGLPRETAEAFIIGFLRRDFGAAGLYSMTENGALDAVQVLVAAVTITLFIPCIAQFFMTVKERGWRTGLAVAAFVTLFAVGVGATLNFVLRALQVTL